MAYTPKDWSTPDWKKKSRVHEWKNYISKELEAMWSTFNDAQKQALARNADDIASREHWD
jgi:S-formylglutathione hydrolase FrmB